MSAKFYSICRSFHIITYILSFLWYRWNHYFIIYFILSQTYCLIFLFQIGPAQFLRFFRIFRGQLPAAFCQSVFMETLAVLQEPVKKFLRGLVEIPVLTVGEIVIPYDPQIPFFCFHHFQLLVLFHIIFKNFKNLFKAHALCYLLPESLPTFWRPSFLSARLPPLGKRKAEGAQPEFRPVALRFWGLSPIYGIPVKQDNISFTPSQSSYCFWRMSSKSVS